jgi:polar amino acid transport system substrate-binding protein
MKTVPIVCVACLILAWCATSYAQPPLRFARIENIPDQFVGGEILKVVYSRLKIPVELVDLPAKRALMESSAGKLDGEVHRNINVQKQYPTLIMIRPAINYIEPSVFSKKYRFEVKGWDSIKRYTIGIVHGVGTSEDGTRGMEQVLAVTTLDQLMLMLAADRIDVAVSDSFSGLAVVRKLHLEDRIKVLTPPLQKSEIYHFLHNKHRNLVPKVEKVLREMQASGELELLRTRIIKAYLAQSDNRAREK